jgi:hypothetical protein
VLSVILSIVTTKRVDAVTAQSRAVTVLVGHFTCGSGARVCVSIAPSAERALLASGEGSFKYGAQKATIAA